MEKSVLNVEINISGLARARAKMVFFDFVTWLFSPFAWGAWEDAGVVQDECYFYLLQSRVHKVSKKRVFRREKIGLSIGANLVNYKKHEGKETQTAC